MNLTSIGLNHNTAPIEIRERAAVTRDRLHDALRDLTTDQRVSEAAIVSTCNRTEIYCNTHTPSADLVTQWMSRFHGLDQHQVAPYLYELPGPDAVKHAFRVASGMDSLVVGEPQILGQMKDAFATAQAQGTTGKILNKLFQTTFSVAKRVRTATGIGENAVSVASAAVALARQVFADVGQKTVLLVGAGETIELVCRHLIGQGVKRIIIANRSLERAQSVASAVGGSAISLSQLPEYLHQADMLISSTASTLPIIGKGAIESALKKRKRQPMLLIDLAVPRDIEPEAGSLSNIFLYSVDDLQQVVSENIEGRKEALIEAEKIVDSSTRAFVRWYESLDALPTLTGLRAQTQQVAEDQIAIATRRLAAGDDPHEVLDLLAHTLTQKFFAQTQRMDCANYGPGSARCATPGL